MSKLLVAKVQARGEGSQLQQKGPGLLGPLQRTSLLHHLQPGGQELRWQAAPRGGRAPSVHQGGFAWMQQQLCGKSSPQLQQTWSSQVADGAAEGGSAQQYLLQNRLRHTHWNREGPAGSKHSHKRPLNVSQESCTHEVRLVAMRHCQVQNITVVTSSKITSW